MPPVSLKDESINGIMASLVWEYHSLQGLEVYNSQTLPQTTAYASSNNPVPARTIAIMRLPNRHSYLRMLLDLDLGVTHKDKTFDL